MFREYGDWGFTVSEATKGFIAEGNTASDQPGQLTVVTHRKWNGWDNIYEGDSNVLAA
jgi:acyl-CoA-binding protein